MLLIFVLCNLISVSYYCCLCCCAMLWYLDQYNCILFLRSEGICSYYTGSLCEPVYNSRPSRVFFNFSLGSTPADIENRLQESWMEQESIITQRCRDVVLRILCHLALPDCASPVTESSLSGGQQLSHLQPRVLPLCRCVLCNLMFIFI